MSIKFSEQHAPQQNGENPPRNVGRALLRGLKLKCPNCGRGRLFRRYLKVADSCATCREAFHHHRADDAPPYFTILVVGHILLPIVIAVELSLTPPFWVHAALWIPATLALTVAVLAPIKGAIVSLQWALYMHGFDTRGAGEDTLG